ncbi:MAG: FAD-dependent oxidoreductase [Bacilli bacterium]|nr:FAD-dependent oxidoreductase [Bacilli bacterium]
MKDLSSIFNACLGCKVARCKTACPCGNDIPAVLAALKEGDEAKASSILHSTNPFPEWTSLLCDHERQCRGNCIRGIRSAPVDFPEVEKELSRAFPFPYQAGKETTKRVAIVGAGPSALSCATFLRQAGIHVEIFERENQIGGAMLTGIPAFRFAKDNLAKTRENLERLGVLFHFGKELNKDDMEGLRADFGDVVLAIGAEKENRLSTPPCPDIYAALSLLADINLRGDYHGLNHVQHIVVMGGGNVAMDISRSLVRLDTKVTLIYRRDEASMPAQRHEIAEAKEDGVVFCPLTNVADYCLDDNGRLTGLRLVRMELGEKDESGRPSFHTIEGSEFDMACDAFVMAIGEKSDLGRYYAAEEVQGNLHAIGDCSYGAKNIAAAIRSGREMAEEIIAK